MLRRLAIALTLSAALIVTGAGTGTAGGGVAKVKQGACVKCW